ncbi:uncharacterized protein UBRO_01516 [Ustilago bromivora]|uniref:Uncharacterized protein n=1 Tax=Ustilago bromivora TaxID=307758 RepID=A0A1K0FZ42_9BASI|nr:uncharacterized protein UBRO_01516 [Ustilago bromivora]SYW82431.1 uncharacterized protein UBRO2_04553 [Ustilago bromivora]
MQFPGRSTPASASTSAQAPPSPHMLLATVQPTPLHPLQEDALVLQYTRSSTDSPKNERDGARIQVNPEHARSHLPRRAPDQDAHAARDKLDRIAKAQKQKKNWAKSTGVTLVAKAFGQNDRRLRRRAYGASSDDDSSDDAFRDDDRASTKGEVKLMITGNPVVTKVFDAASRAKGRFRNHPDSTEVSLQNEDAPFRFLIGRPGSSLARRFRTGTATPPPEAALKSAVSSPVVQGQPRISRNGTPTTGLDRTKSRVAPSSGPELLVVDEEGHSHQASESPAPGSPNHPALPFSRSLNNHTPSSMSSSQPSDGNSPGNTPAAEQPKQVSDSASSLIAGPMCFEPDAHEPAIVASPSQAHGFPSPAPSSSVSDASSDDELDDSAVISDSDEGGDNMLQLNSLNLEHGETLTKDQLKRRQKLIRREIQRRKANGEPIDDLIHMHGKVGQLGHKVSSRVSKGLHYASSQSRNRRAMDRYSPHPMQLSLQTTDLPPSTSAQSAGVERGMTPFSAITPSLSRSSNPFSNPFSARRESVATIASSRRSSMTVDNEDDPNYGDGTCTMRRSSMIDRSILSSRNSIRKYLHAPDVIKRRRRKKWEAEMAALEHAAEVEANKADPDAELDTLLAKHAQQEAPTDATKVKYEFDVLYENQRGLLVFGIPKFSYRTLFQWDPSPWTSANGKRSPYNIANAQLPDPSWEWAYHEWFIDMTGDVDEAGWQYSGNFGRRFWPNVHFPHGRIGLPKTGADGIAEMNARNAAKEKKRQEKESTKEDDGFEAIKRSARARSSKWTGSPDAWTFVRRRRWIRLRRRKPLTSPNAPKGGDPVSTQGKAGTPVQDLPIPDGVGKTPLSSGKNGVKPGKSDDELDDESSFGGSDESDSSSSQDDEMLYAPAFGRSSGFLPGRLPGGMSNGPNPAKSKDPRQRQRARKQAREFTGTIRELKSLLPSIIAMDREARVHRAPTGLTASQSSYKWAMLKINKVDARNPFISWHFVKHRLQDEDMAFATTTLRTMERKFQQRQLGALNREGAAAGENGATPSHQPIPSGFLGASKSIRFEGAEAQEAPTLPNGVEKGETSASGLGLTSNTSSSRLQEPFSATSTEGHELTREALIEINFARVLRVLRACKIDRQRMDLWKLWLGVVSLDYLMETARREDLAALGLLAPIDPSGDPTLPPTSTSPAPVEPPHMSGGSSFRYRQRAERTRARWRSSVPTPDPSDVWDVLERKLDDVLLLFEFQSNRAQLIRLLLTVHEKLHPEHVYRDRSLRANPVELSPAHVHGDAAEIGGPATGGAFGSRLGGWKRAGLPRLEFFSDLQRILAALPGNDATVNKGYICSEVPMTEEVAMPLDHHASTSTSSNALIDKLEAEAVSDSFLDKEHIRSPSATMDVRPEAGAAKQEGAQQGQRLSLNLPTAGDRGGMSRSPSPIPRAPSVPLPYKHSPLSATVPLGQGLVSTHGRSSLSIAERTEKAGNSTHSTPPSSAPGADDDAATPTNHKPTILDASAMQGSTSNQQSSDPTTTSASATDKVVTEEQGQSTLRSKTEASSPQKSSGTTTAPRPSIPVRTNSVSPLTASKERF